MAAPALVASIDSLPLREFTGEAFRHIAEAYDPMSGAGARIHGGRWNPRDSYSVLYLGLDVATVGSEFRRLVGRQARSVADFLPRSMYRYNVTLTNALDLRAPTALQAVGLQISDVQADDLGRCQDVGEAAHHAGREAILAPSAAGDGDVLAIFLDRLEPDSAVQAALLEVWEAPSDLPQALKRLDQGPAFKRSISTSREETGHMPLWPEHDVGPSVHGRATDGEFK